MVGRKGRPVWDAEGWRKPGEVSSKDYRMIELERQGGNIFMICFWQMKELGCTGAVTFPRFQKSKIDFLMGRF